MLLESESARGFEIERESTATAAPPIQGIRLEGPLNGVRWIVHTGLEIEHKRSTSLRAHPVHHRCEAAPPIDDRSLDQGVSQLERLTKTDVPFDPTGQLIMREVVNVDQVEIECRKAVVDACAARAVTRIDAPNVREIPAGSQDVRRARQLVGSDSI